MSCRSATALQAPLAATSATLAPQALCRPVGVTAILPVLMVLGAVLAVCTVAERLGLDGAPDYV
ncbi:hypothetical protein [Acidithiobacillus ferrivorans]|nr:hypothetical protein [Acidithiobacillus ferrivorans]